MPIFPGLVTAPSRPGLADLSPVQVALPCELRKGMQRQGKSEGVNKLGDEGMHTTAALMQA